MRLQHENTLKGMMPSSVKQVTICLENELFLVCQDNVTSSQHNVITMSVTTGELGGKCNS